MNVSEKIPPDAIEPLAEDMINAKFTMLVSAAEDSIIVVNPFLDDNKYTRRLLSIAEKRTLLLVTRTPEDVHWNRVKHKDVLNKFEKNSFIIRDRNVHAKILLVDKKKCIISSMNLTRNSIVESKEYGVYLESPVVVNSILEFIDGLGEIENPEITE